MAISSKTVAVSMLLLSAVFFVLLSAPAHARKLGTMRAPTSSVRRPPAAPCTPRSILQEVATQTESTTTPGHSPSIGHNSPPN
ncbi:hypothetical protein Zm00014a_007470 [Zea mays]|uniref:Uncharacterized protein n=2 Tax=Zea mays TaxID=4577 RepID=A0A1D6LN66_MAIZE|nr:hypothetical protein ZEAMMB73_Zm00001d036436 [Zea mays]PWZ19710.1 hypothetical protein Zm00014a_007470 [Zea mays]